MTIDTLTPAQEDQLTDSLLCQMESLANAVENLYELGNEEPLLHVLGGSGRLEALLDFALVARLVRRAYMPPTVRRTVLFGAGCTGTCLEAFADPAVHNRLNDFITTKLH